MKKLIAFYLILVLIYAINSNDTEPQTDYNPPTNHNPEPGREVHHFDWKAMEYVYQDQIPKSKPHDYRGTQGFLPDFYIQGYTDRSLPGYVIIDDRRFEVRELPNEDLELIESR